jgi:hypothetical protein
VVPPAFPSDESPQHVDNERVAWIGSTSPALPARAFLDPAVEGIDQMVEGPGLRSPLRVRSQKIEARSQKPEARSQKPEARRNTRSAVFPSSGF